MAELRKIKLEKFTATSVIRRYYLKHKVTGEYAHGVFYTTNLEHVPGKTKRQRVCRPKICGRDTPITLDMDDVNKIIAKAVRTQISSQLDDFELLTVDRVIGIVPVGKMDLKKKKENAEMVALANKLRRAG